MTTGPSYILSIQASGTVLQPPFLQPVISKCSCSLASKSISYQSPDRAWPKEPNKTSSCPLAAAPPSHFCPSEPSSLGVSHLTPPLRGTRTSQGDSQPWSPGKGKDVKGTVRGHRGATCQLGRKQGPSAFADCSCHGEHHLALQGGQALLLASKCGAQRASRKWASSTGLWKL